MIRLRISGFFPDNREIVAAGSRTSAVNGAHETGAVALWLFA